MKIKVILLAIAISVCSYSQNLQTGYIGDLKLVNGQTIYDCKVCYTVAGKMKSDGSNVIIYPSWFGGKSENTASTGARLFDTTKFCIIGIDALGNGKSSSPSNSEKQKDAKFPEISIKDMVNSEYLLLTKVLGFKHIYGMMGGSMGGMQIFQWVVSYPDFMDKAAAYVGSPKLTSFDVMLWKTEILAIGQWEKNGGSVDELADLINTIHNLLITTPADKNRKVPREEFDKYLGDINSGFRKIFRPYDWKSQLRAMSVHDISLNNSMKDAAEKIKADFFIITDSKDLIVNPVPAMNFADEFHFKKFVFDNDCGHLGPGCEWDTFKKILNDFFNDSSAE